MTAEALLSRLDKVRPTGPDRWLAACPAHADKSPSLSVREMPDGRSLVHCFGGCSVDAVLDAVSLEISDLFPERPTDQRCPIERRPFAPRDVLQALYHEVLVVQVAAHEIRRRGYLLDPDIERLDLAAARIESGLTLTEGAARHDG